MATAHAAHKPLKSLQLSLCRVFQHGRSVAAEEVQGMSCSSIPRLSCNCCKAENNGWDDGARSGGTVTSTVAPRTASNGYKGLEVFFGVPKFCTDMCRVTESGEEP